MAERRAGVLRVYESDWNSRRRAQRAGVVGTDGGRARRRQAEIFATNNTAVITDPADPRLQDRLKGFAREVERIIDEGGARARGSELLDGVFASGETTTFERSRVFDVDRLDDDELHTIADTIRARFAQQSVLTFEPGPRRRDPARGPERERAGPA